MGSVSPVNSLVDWSDSFYAYVRGRILAINPSRAFSGIVQARSWPIEEAVAESFYLLLGSANPVKTDGTWTRPSYGEKMQWAWMILGTDIPANVQMRNRGDRYRTNFQMTQEILHGMFAGFCQKQSFALVENAGQPVVQSTPYTPQESLWFKKPIFTTRFDRASGALFGYASTEVTGYGPMIPNP